MYSNCPPSFTECQSPPIGDRRSSVGRFRLAHQRANVTADKVIIHRVAGTTSISLLPTHVLISEVGDEYVVLKPIPAEIQKVDGSYIASFDAANAHASGETWGEAVLNLRYYLTDLYDSLLRHRPERLGPIPKRQLIVLQSFLANKT